MIKKCLSCGKLFKPDKMHPYQKICFNKECRILQRSINLRKWRIRNPDYFKNRTDNLEMMKEWRKNNPNYYKEYRKNNPKIKEKTRIYVKAFRERCKQNQLFVD